jgi:hypothetical protein
MSVYAIDAVKINPESGRIEQVRWGKIDLHQHIWETEPVIVNAVDVINNITSGDEVWTAFPIGQLTVLGPKVGIVENEHGSKEIEIIDPDNHPGRTLGDMPVF